jgi:hypothetical protein
VDVVRVRWAARELVSEHLKDMRESIRVVDVDVGDPAARAREERELQVAVVVLALEAAGR